MAREVTSRLIAEEAARRANRELRELRAQHRIAQATTPEKVWGLVEVLAFPQNGYSDETILRNLRAYVALAQALTRSENTGRTK